MSDKTCAERVLDHFEGRMEDLRLMWAGYTGQDCPECDGNGCIEVDPAEDVYEDCKYCGGTGKAPEDVPDVGNFNEYGLSFDYVAPHTFNDQPRGYFRYQLSWGGPSDEFRIYAEGREYRWNVDAIEYWFMDWFDGAKHIPSGEDYKLLSDLFDSLFVETGTAEAQYNEAMKDYKEPEEEDDDQDDDEE